jgi:hypothetical protein
MLGARTTGNALRRLFYPRELSVGEPGRSDDVRQAVGEVLDCRLGRGELDEDAGVVGRGFGGRDAGPAGLAELAEVGAELGGAWLDGAAGELHAFGF